MPRGLVVKQLAVVVVLAAAEVADNGLPSKDDVAFIALFVADLWLAGSIVGWLLARLARTAPAVDTVMMRLVIPHLRTVELVRKSHARMEAARARQRAELQRQRIL